MSFPMIISQVRAVCEIDVLDGAFWFQMAFKARVVFLRQVQVLICAMSSALGVPCTPVK